MILTPHSKHLILAAIAGVLVLLISWKVVAHLDGTAHDQAVLAKAQVDADFQKAKLQAGQTQADKTALQSQLNNLAASNANSRAEIQALRSQLADQRKQDTTLNPNDLAGRWATLIGTSATEIKASTNGIEASIPAAHATVDALEEVPELKEEAKKQAANSVEKDNTLQSQQKLIASTEAELGTCKKTVVDQDTACKAEIKAVKATARKHAVWSAIGGFIGGLLFDKYKAKI